SEVYCIVTVDFIEELCHAINYAQLTSVCDWRMIGRIRSCCIFSLPPITPNIYFPRTAKSPLTLYSLGCLNIPKSRKRMWPIFNYLHFIIDLLQSDTLYIFVILGYQVVFLR
uniref:Uncharacterized protein n=1 Tax=Parascaris univalens TaxID=6257 RepID=A0A915BP21_PARUN